MPQRTYTLTEEIGNTITHSLGGLICAFLFGILVHSTFTSSSDLMWKVGCCLFGFSSIFAFVASSMYHAVTCREIKAVLKKYDHIAIYFLIAGTYIPLIIRFMMDQRPVMAWSFIAIQAIAVLGGTLYKTIVKNCYGIASVLIYCMLGWSIFPAMFPMLHSMNSDVINWFLAGAASYMAGVPFYILKQYKWTHTIWHVFVLFGIICHYMMMLKV